MTSHDVYLILLSGMREYYLKQGLEVTEEVDLGLSGMAEFLCALLARR